jgi:hypothetical protein
MVLVSYKHIFKHLFLLFLLSIVDKIFFTKLSTIFILITRLFQQVLPFNNNVYISYRIQLPVENENGKSCQKLVGSILHLLPKQIQN